MRKRLLIRIGVLCIVAVLVGAITVAAMPTPLPKELAFLDKLNAKVTDTPKHVGCASDEQIYPGTTYTVDMTPQQISVTLHQHLDGNPNWSFVTPEKNGVLARRLPMIHDGWGPHPAIEIESTANPMPPQNIAVSDYREPYNVMVYWIIKLTGK